MRNYFCGWYYKCQSRDRTVAVIPACHIAEGVKTCSIQIISDGGSWNVEYPISQYHMDKNGITIGSSHFSKQGCRLEIRADNLQVAGELRFGLFTPIAYDIMGPFQYVPFLECRHSVFSMRHRVDGRIAINGEVVSFCDGVGYMEGDRGSSFPKEYLWTQCCFREGSIMLSVADIPFCGFHFTGIIGIVHYGGREYRFATYLGARAVKIRDGEVVIRQGKMAFTARRLEDRGKPLAAPVGGKMKRMIRESAACRTFYCFQEKGKTVFEFTSPMASFEYEYPQ